MKKLNRKGFSVVEVIIAMVVISIVTATSLSIVSVSADNTKAAAYRAEAQYFAADALECFKPAQSADHFYSILENFRGGVTLDQLPEEYKDDYVRLYRLNGSNYPVYIYENFNSVEGAVVVTFKILVLDNSGQEIAKIEYSKLRRAA